MKPHRAQTCLGFMVLLSITPRKASKPTKPTKTLVQWRLGGGEDIGALNKGEYSLEGAPPPSYK